jgi:thiamine biosynthesis protein ThiI
MKAVLLLSGGIDSPVAGYMMKRKLELIPVYFDNSPYADQTTKERAMDSARKLGLKKIVIVPHGKNLSEFAEKCERKYTCVLCKRMMYRIAERIAKKHKAVALVTGESLAQVASQTSWNLFVLNDAVSIPVVRPLIGFDKNETIKISKEAGLYDISIRPAMCCGIVPKKPSTRADLKRIKQEEKKVNIGKMVKESVERAREC